MRCLPWILRAATAQRFSDFCSRPVNTYTVRHNGRRETVTYNFLRMRAVKPQEVAMSNYERFQFDYHVGRAMGLDHWDALWAGLAWVG